MRLYICYYKQANTMYVYDTFVFVGDMGANYEYDSSGHLTKATTNSGSVKYEYTGPRVRKMEVERRGGSNYTVDYTYYNNTNNVHTAIEKTKKGNQTPVTISEKEYFYGTGGVVTKCVTTADGASTEQNYQYTNDNNDLSKVIDGSGLWGEYTYASKNHNIVTTSTASDGSVYSYAYIGYQDYLQTIMSGGSQNTYNYEDDMLGSIVHNGTTYAFSYNNLGQVTTTKIGDQTIAQNNYDAKTQRLTSTVYGNGHSYMPSYDSMGRVTSERYNGRLGAAHTYTYANDNSLTKATSSETQRTTQFSYDISGRLTEIKGFNTANKSEPTSARMRYDDSGALKQLKITADGALLSDTHYAYDDRDRPATTTLDSLGGGTLSYAYIGLGRLGGVTQTLANSGVAETEYAYLNYNSNATSFVAQMTNTLPGGVTTYGYTYKPGSSNIATIKENNVLQHTYTYDSLGQLTKDITPSKTMDYAYDVGGNITSIKENNVVARSFA